MSKCGGWPEACALGLHKVNLLLWHIRKSAITFVPSSHATRPLHPIPKANAIDIYSAMSSLCELLHRRALYVVHSHTSQRSPTHLVLQITMDAASSARAAKTPSKSANVDLRIPFESSKDGALSMGLVVFYFSGRSPFSLLRKGLKNHASPPNKAECSFSRVAWWVHSLPCSFTCVGSVCDEVGA